MPAYQQRFEVLFRRTVALERSLTSDRSVVRMIDGVGSAAGGESLSAPPPVNRLWPPHQVPARALVPSAGHFNTTRIAPDAQVWLFVVTAESKAAFREFVLSICNVQSARPYFRPMFALWHSHHIEVLRQFGFTFEMLFERDLTGRTAEEQIETIIAKWAVRLRYVIDDRNIMQLSSLSEAETRRGAASLTEALGEPEQPPALAMSGGD